MAEAVLSNIASGIISKLSSSALKEIGLTWGIKDELQNLNRTVSKLEGVLLHAEELSIEDRQLKKWLAMQSEAMYDADDLVDEISTDALRLQALGSSKMGKKVRLFFSSSFGTKIAQRVREIREKLDEIAEARRFRFVERSGTRGFGVTGKDQTHLYPPQVVIGRDLDKDKIVEVLLSSDYEENVSVVAIVGMGGLGKTTLAQLVYNDDMVQKHFELKMWVHVSDKYNVNFLVRKVLESASGKTPQNTRIDSLKNLLREKINGRRYLLVLDDMWDDSLKWSGFKDLLTGGAGGSKIVITTQIITSTVLGRSISVLELKGLFQNEAWALFKQTAFKQGQVPNQSHESLGRDILPMCHGVPLIIKAVGGVLYCKDMYSEWLLLKNEILSKIDADDNDTLAILKLSFSHLPAHYKQCIACCCLYPKGFEIHVDELIHLWKAQGYLKSADSNERLRDVGFGYFMDLFRLSFFQDVQKDEFGNITVCRMNDIMHAVAISVAGDNFSLTELELEYDDDGSLQLDYVHNKSLHLSYWFDDWNLFLSHFSSLLKGKKVRTVIFELKEARSTVFDINEKELNVLFRNSRCLRVLKFSHMGISKMPNSISELKLIRYLDISKNQNIEVLPDSITNLINLQVFNLRWCVKLMQLPKNINKLVSLIDLDNYACFGLTHMPRGIGQLTQLEKLSRFVIAKDHSIFKGSGGLDELHALNNLRGELEITNLSYVRKVAVEFKAADLSAKKNLQKLTLDWTRYEGANDNSNSNDVASDEMGLEALKPHQNLKGLSVVCYRGLKPPSWLASLTNLVSIGFVKCRSVQWLPPFDQLPYLKSLMIVDSSKLERINVENGGSSSFFPSLTDLILTNCPNLKGFLRCNTAVGTESSSIMEDLPCFHSLTELDVKGCPNLTYMPLFWELKRLKIEGNSIKSFMEILKITTSESQSTFSYFLSLSQLESLSITKLEGFPEDELPVYLPSLRHLEFKLCTFKSLSSDQKGGMLWRRLQVLYSIEFVSMQNLVSLPMGLQYVTTLQRLYIHGCDSLAYVPEWIGNLIELEFLIISDCQKLSERCKNNKAEDWPKISHIPNISVDSQSIQRNGLYLL